MMIKISPKDASNDEQCLVLKLLCECFRDACNLVNYACNGGLMDLLNNYPYYKPTWLFAVKDNGKPVSTLYVIDRLIKINGEVVKVGGIAGVCTSAKYRGRGYASSLLKYAIDELRGTYDALALFTTYGSVAYSIYRKVGFRDIFLREYGIVPVIDLRQVNDGEFNASNASESDADSFLRIYNNEVKDLDGILIRDINYIKDHVIKATWLRLTTSINANVLKLSKGSETLAYALTTGIDEDGIVTVMEVASIDCESALALLNHIVKVNGAKGLRVYATRRVFECINASVFRVPSTYMMMNLGGINYGEIREPYIYRLDQW